MMKQLTIPKSIVIPARSTTKLADKYWIDEACIMDMDQFIKNLSSIKAKGVRPDLISSLVANYASKWLPDHLCTDEPSTNPTSSEGSSPDSSVTASWLKKRFFVETLVGILPPDDSVPCNFLLRLLRTANMVGIELNYRAELEKRISWQLDQASLKELMIPAFSHTCGTLLDVELVLRLVQRFINLDEGSKSGSALVKVAKLVDFYLGEAALDSKLTTLEFVTLAAALPCHARITDDWLYRAIDTYLKVHPGVPKQERKIIFRLIDSQKLSPEASFHAAQNDCLPVRAVIQVLFSEQTKLNRQFEWSGSINGARSPNPVLEPPVQCLSKCDIANQQMEIKKLREDLLRLWSRCNFMQGQIERLTEVKKKKKKKKGFLRYWRYLAVPLCQSVNVAERFEEGEGEGKLEFERQTPMNTKKTKLVHGRTPGSPSFRTWVS